MPDRRDRCLSHIPLRRIPGCFRGKLLGSSRSIGPDSKHYQSESSLKGAQAKLTEISTVRFAVRTAVGTRCRTTRCWMPSPTYSDPYFSNDNRVARPSHAICQLCRGLQLAECAAQDQLVELIDEALMAYDRQEGYAAGSSPVVYLV